MIYNCMYRAFKNGPILLGRWDTSTGLIEGVVKEAFFYQDRILIDRFKDFVVDSEPTRSDMEYMYDVLICNPDVNFVVMFASLIFYYIDGKHITYEASGETYKREGGNLFEGPHLHIGYLKTVPLNYYNQVFQYRLYVVIGSDGDYIYTQYGQRKVSFQYDKSERIVGMTFLELSNTPDSVLGFYTCNGKAKLLYKD